MTNKNKVKLSQFLSLILRHKPEVINITLDRQGYADIDELISGIKDVGKYIDLKLLKEIVETDNKQRYSFDKTGKKIRANQGHSISVDLELIPVNPPEELYHGTATKFLENILTTGIKSMNRNYVHLSSNIETAKKVGFRHGDPIVLVIDARQMFEDNHTFYLSENGVYLIDFIPTKYIKEQINFTTKE